VPSNADLLAIKKSLSNRYLPKKSTATSRLSLFAATVSTTPAQNVVGVGVGTKFTDGKETSTKCVRFYVATKIHKDALTKKQLLPGKVDGVPTDVIVTGPFRQFSTASDNKLKRRPVRPGTSIGFEFPPPKDNFVMAGTFGAVVTKGGKQFILSNNHVLAENGLIALGGRIFQPGLLDGGNAATDQVAQLTKFIQIKPNVFNKVDCAIARFLPGAPVNPRHMPSVGKLGSTVPIAAAVNMLVMKTGRTTGHTRGQIFDVSADVTVPYEDKNGNEFLGRFSNQILIVGTPGSFSTNGDSGSLIVDRATSRATGLLFAGSSTHTIANHIEDVLAALGVSLVTA
jgi:hypothetical protein